MSRAYTPEECREMFLRQVREIAKYWAEESRSNRTEACEGVAFSILTMLDGCSVLPGFKVIPDPHPSDERYHRSKDENFWPDYCDIRENVMMHEEFYRREKK